MKQKLIPHVNWFYSFSMAINQIKERKVKKKINQQMNDFNLIKKKGTIWQALSQTKEENQVLKDI